MKQQLVPIDVALKKSLDELFSSEQERQDAKKPKVEELPLGELSEFEGHPFQVKDDEDMAALVESMKAGGVLTPAIVRPKEGGGYEVISGHRRLMAARKLGLATIPAIIRDMTDAEAVVTMVDANLQREHILPSEKAFAYKMKLEALAQQGKRTDLTSGQVGQKWARDEVSQEDSGRQVQRYIRLTHLIKPLLDMVDGGKIAMSPAVELSYLSEKEQATLLDAMEEYDCTPSHAQARELKALSQQGTLDAATVQTILGQEKPNQIEHVKLRRDELSKFIPSSFTDEQTKQAILQGLAMWHRHRQRQRDGAR